MARKPRPNVPKRRQPNVRPTAIPAHEFQPARLKRITLVRRVQHVKYV